MENVNEGASLEFKWLKKRGVAVKNKDVQFYESFIYDGVEYKLYDCVYMYKEGLLEPYIGKLTKIWELPNKTKKVKVHWLFRPEEISNWLKTTKTLDNEILFASGEGLGLADISPLEAIAGQCNVVCVSKDSRNPQPSDEQLKAADFIFYRTFDVRSCTISEKMDDEVGGLEIKFVFNREKGEKTNPLSESTSDKKEECPNLNPNSITSSEAQQLLTKTLPNKLKDDEKAEDIPKLLERKTKPAESDKSHDRPLKKNKSDYKTPPQEKHVDLPSVKSEVVELPVDGKSKADNNPKAVGTYGINSEMGKSNKAGDKGEMKVSIAPQVKKCDNKEKNKSLTGSDKLHDRPPLKRRKPDDKTPPEEKSKQEDKLPADVNNLKASSTAEETPNRKNGKISAKATDDFEGKSLKKTKGDSSHIMLDNKKNKSVQKQGNNTKDLVANSALSEGNLKSGLALDSIGNKMEPKDEQSSESKKKLSMNKSFKGSALSTDRDKKNPYREFFVTPKPNDEKAGWFRRLPWEDRLKNAYDQGTAILLFNLDPDYTSGEVEDIIWHAFNENCEAKIVQRTAVSSPHYGQALILLKTSEAAQRVLTKLDEECLMLPNKRPLVGTPCPPISTKKNAIFFGHLNVDRARFQNLREDEAVSTSHFSQPNTIEYDMAMEWCLLQLRSKRWWEKIHKHQESELKKLLTELQQKKS